MADELRKLFCSTAAGAAAAAAAEVAAAPLLSAMAAAAKLRLARGLAAAALLLAAGTPTPARAASTEEPPPVPAGCRSAEELYECLSANLTELPRRLPATTTQLVLSHNQLPQIKDGQLTGAVYEHLTRVLLEHNGIQEVEKFSFSGMYRVSELSLAHNELPALPPDMLCPEALSNLSLAANPLRAPPKGPLLGSASLQELSLEGTSLQHLQRDMFSKLPQLLTLNLANSTLHECNPQALAPLPELRSLSLARNNISRLHADAFENNPELRRLNVSGTQLGGADWPALARPLAKLEVLDLRGCEPASSCDCALLELAQRCRVLTDRPCPDPADCPDGN